MRLRDFMAHSPSTSRAPWDPATLRVEINGYMPPGLALFDGEVLIIRSIDDDIREMKSIPPRIEMKSSCELFGAFTDRSRLERLLKALDLPVPEEG